MNAYGNVPRGLVPAARQLAVLSDRVLLAVAFAFACTVADDTGLAACLHLSAGELVRVRRAPLRLSLDRRLALATLVGASTDAVAVAREIRRRTSHRNTT